MHSTYCREKFVYLRREIGYIVRKRYLLIDLRTASRSLKGQLSLTTYFKAKVIIGEMKGSWKECFCGDC